MGCSSSKESSSAVHGFTERKGPDVHEEHQRRRAKQRTKSLTVNEDSDNDNATQQEDDCNLDFRHTENVCLQLDDLPVRYACYSKKGRDPDALRKPNQDSYSHHGRDGGFITTDDAFFGVYDGHGPTGEECSNFVRLHLPRLIRSNLQEHFSLNANIIQDCLHRAHVQCNQALHAHQEIDDSYSGTTSCCLLLQPSRVTMANVGDSRCILGTCQGTGGSSSRWKALPLSKDQTPRRHDEAKRCRQAGARILSFGQLSGDTRDEDLEDPPRVWAPDGNYPGTAFTRSLGDRVAKRLGVTAEPEVLPISLSKHEKCLVIASDGIWDVLSNQQIMDICQNHHGDPHQACREIVETAHREWLKNDLCASEDDPDASYDDITVVVIMLGQVETTKDDTQGKDEDMPPTAEQPLADVTTEKTKKRVRQKTLRHMEDGPKEDVFFVGSTTSPPEEAASSQTES